MTKRKPRVKAEDVSVLCEQILLEMTDGDEPISIASLASRAGISRGSIYTHFRMEGYEDARAAVDAAEHRRLARFASPGEKAKVRRDLESRLAHVEAENQTLHHKISELMEALTAITVNAQQYGVDVDKLWEPLERPRR